jgi:MYXO-CTERM domain-containing protein
MSDETRRILLARRARFVAATLAGAVSLGATSARASDADAGDSSDAGLDASDIPPPPPEFARPCLSPPYPERSSCLCGIGAEHDEAPVAPALAAAAALLAAGRRKKKST